MGNSMAFDADTAFKQEKAALGSVSHIDRMLFVTFYASLAFKKCLMIYPSFLDSNVCSVLHTQLDHEWELDSAEEKAVEVLKTLLLQDKM